MKNKKILALILSFTMSIGSLQMTVLADETDENTSGSTQEVTQEESASSPDEEVPEEEKVEKDKAPVPEVADTDETKSGNSTEKDDSNRDADEPQDKKEEGKTEAGAPSPKRGVAKSAYKPFGDVVSSGDYSAYILSSNVYLLTDDVDLSDGYIYVPQGVTATIDLNGHTIDRKHSEASSDGNAIFNEGTLIITDSSAGGNGLITGGYSNNGGGINNRGTLTVEKIILCANKAKDCGGAIFNYESGTATIRNVTMVGNNASGNSSNNSRGGAVWNKGSITFEGKNTISDNKSDDGGGVFNEAGGSIIFNGDQITDNESLKHGGGGIVNSGTITFQGENTITGNKSSSNGGGVWNEGVLKISGADNKLVIKENDSTRFATDNLFLSDYSVITLTDDAELNDSFKIYLSTWFPQTRNLTSGWKGRANNGRIIAEDKMMLDSGSTELKGKITYIERSWNASSKKVVSEEKGVSGSDTVDIGSVAVNENNVVVLTSGKYYYLTQDTVFNHRVEIFYDVKIILTDGMTLTCNKGIRVEPGSTLSIYAQSGGTGRLVVTDGGSFGNAGIGGNDDCAHGNIYFHGGTVISKGSDDAAGIGTGNETDNSSGSIVIYGGSVTATGGDYGAGIGGGDDCSGGPITIYGGTVTANGGKQGAGIGSGEKADSNDITIYGGVVTANGGESSNSEGGGAGIGTGEGGKYCSSIIIYGGEVTANGGYGGAGVGSGSGAGEFSSVTVSGLIEIDGGNVIAYGGTHAAGIGGGDTCNSNHTIIIKGGNVEAYAARVDDQWQNSDGAAGIGGGADGVASGSDFGGSLTITGGTVKAYGSGQIVDPSYMRAPKGGAGIGGGCSGNMTGTITISGGKVEAVSRCGGAAIGGGTEQAGRGSEQDGTVEIKGTAEVSLKVTNCNYSNEYSHKVQMIGYGSSKNGKHREPGSLTIGGNMMVRFFGEDEVRADQRVATCRTDNVVDTWLYIEPCNHPENTYTITKTTHHQTCACCSSTFQTQAHSFDANNKCTVCGYQRILPSFKGYTVLLTGRIGLNFYMDLSGLTDDQKNNGYMTFEISGGGTVTGRADYDPNVTKDGYYGFVAQINAIQMADTVTATYHYEKDGTEATVTGTYSVKQYCIDFDKKYAEKSTHTEIEDKEKDLVHALADYGHYLQIYLQGMRGWQFDTESGYARMDKFYSTYTEQDLSQLNDSLYNYVFLNSITPNMGDLGIKNITYSLTFDSETCINVYFEMNKGKDFDGYFMIIFLDGGSYKFLSPNDELTLSTNEKMRLEKTADGRYCLRISGIYAQNLNRDFEFDVSTDGTLDNSAARVRVSGCSYMNSLSKDTVRTGANDAAIALYRYWSSAKSYVQN